MATLHSVRINDRHHLTGESGEASMGKEAVSYQRSAVGRKTDNWSASETTANGKPTTDNTKPVNGLY
jgi:hypothetical protein